MVESPKFDPARPKYIVPYVECEFVHKDINRKAWPSSTQLTKWEHGLRLEMPHPGHKLIPKVELRPDGGSGIYESLAGIDRNVRSGPDMVNKKSAPMEHYIFFILSWTKLYPNLGAQSLGGVRKEAGPSEKDQNAILKNKDQPPCWYPNKK